MIQTTPGSEMINIRTKLLRLRLGMRNRKSISERLSQTPPVEESLSANSYIFQLSDEMLLRIFIFVDVKDLMRYKEYKYSFFMFLKEFEGLIFLNIKYQC